MAQVSWCCPVHPGQARSFKWDARVEVASLVFSIGRWNWLRWLMDEGWNAPALQLSDISLGLGPLCSQCLEGKAVSWDSFCR